MPTPHLSNISEEPEIRAAELNSQFEIGGHWFDVHAVGARGCQVTSREVDDVRQTLKYNLECSVTWFEADHKELGPIRIFQDPRIVNKGWILARKSRDDSYTIPALSYFNQHLIFHIGEDYLYYPRAWQVTSAITAWPPEYHQYHHLEDRTPVFDLLSRKPNVATKGISTISILGKLDSGTEERYRESLAKELDQFNKLPASKMTPEDLTPAQAARG